MTTAIGIGIGIPFMGNNGNDPASVTGLVFRIRASKSSTFNTLNGNNGSASTNGTKINYAVDETGNYTLTQPSDAGPYYKASGIGSTPSIDFTDGFASGNKDLRWTGSVSYTNGFTALAVCSVQASGGAGRIFGLAPSGKFDFQTTGLVLQSSFPATEAILYSDRSTDALSISSAALTAGNLVAFLVKVNTDNTGSLRVLGVTQTDTFGGATSVDIATLCLGLRSDDGGNVYKGEIKEVCFFSHSTTTAEDAILAAYVLQNYGIAL